MDCISFLRELKQPNLSACDGVVADVGRQSCSRHQGSVALNSVPNYERQDLASAFRTTRATVCRHGRPSAL